MRISLQQLIFRECGLTALIGCFALAAVATDGMAQQDQQREPQSLQQGQQKSQPLQQGQQQRQPPQQGQQLHPQPLQQGQQQQSRPPYQSLQQLPWTKLCGKVALAAEGQQQSPQDQSQENNICVTFQERLNRAGEFLVSAGIRQGSSEGERLAITVPLGVDLHGDPEVSVDGGKPTKLTYAHCRPLGCTADGKVTSEFMTAIRGGKEIAIEAKGPLGKPMTFALPLAGFAAAYDGQASDVTQYQTARQKLVNAIQARRAEAINKALQNIDKQQQPPPQQ
jgi:invasion protein IalB